LGIIGLPMSGKRTLFEALTRTRSEAESKMDNRLAVVRVPDPRIDTLSDIYNPKKTTFARIEYFLPGLGVSGDGKSKDSLIWTKARDCDALIHVVRNFEASGYGHPEPIKNFRRIDEELVLSDLLVVEKRLERLDSDLKKNRKIEAVEHGLLLECSRILDQGKPLRGNPHLAGSQALRGYTFLSGKPLLVVVNNGDHDSAVPDGLEETVGERCVVIQGKVERELTHMPEGEALDFMAEFGIRESAMRLVIRESYALLGLASFFTVGEDEVRAWTIRNGSRAVDAAEAVHSDIKKGFIRAEVVAYDDLIESGSYAEARKRGLVRLEGKEYSVTDGDVVEFRFNIGK
jgi:GTP-binding protein YchF